MENELPVNKFQRFQNMNLTKLITINITESKDIAKMFHLSQWKTCAISIPPTAKAPLIAWSENI